MATDQLSKNNPDGTVVGQSASDLISFYGAATVAQPSGSAQGAVSTTVSTVLGVAVSGGFAFPTSTALENLVVQCNANRVLVDKLRADLVSLGLIKGSA